MAAAEWRLVLCRARDIALSTHRRHDQRRVYAEYPLITAQGSPYTATLAREVVARLADDGAPSARAVLLVATGESISEAARRTGVSRPALYRAQERVRAQLDE